MHHQGARHALLLLLLQLHCTRVTQICAQPRFRRLHVRTSRVAQLLGVAC
jgi:hypothetical protein